MRGPLALVDADPDGGFNVRDTRSGEPLAWRGSLGEANSVAAHLSACYPAGICAPAYDSLVHEIAMARIGGEPECPLHIWAHDEVNLCGLIPDAVDDRPALWKPLYDEGE